MRHNLGVLHYLLFFAWLSILTVLMFRWSSEKGVLQRKNRDIEKKTPGVVTGNEVYVLYLSRDSTHSGDRTRQDVTVPLNRMNSNVSSPYREVSLRPDGSFVISSGKWYLRLWTLLSNPNGHSTVQLHDKSLDHSVAAVAVPGSQQTAVPISLTCLLDVPRERGESHLCIRVLGTDDRPVTKHAFGGYYTSQRTVDRAQEFTSSQVEIRKLACSTSRD